MVLVWVNQEKEMSYTGNTKLRVKGLTGVMKSCSIQDAFHGNDFWWIKVGDLDKWFWDYTFTHKILYANISHRANQTKLKSNELHILQQRTTATNFTCYNKGINISLIYYIAKYYLPTARQNCRILIAPSSFKKVWNK